MICPACLSPNLPGCDQCGGCQLDLSGLDGPVPQDRVDASLMTDPVLALRPNPPVVVPDTADLAAAVTAMTAGHVGAVLVTGPAGELVGILTERDFLTKVADRPQFGDLPVRQFMTADPETVRPADPLAFALGKMVGGGYRHLPVVDGGKPTGVISVRDVLRHVAKLCDPKAD